MHTASESQGVFYLPSTRRLALISCKSLTSIENILSFKPLKVEQALILIPIHIVGDCTGNSNEARGIICSSTFGKS